MVFTKSVQRAFRTAFVMAGVAGAAPAMAQDQAVELPQGWDNHVQEHIPTMAEGHPWMHLGGATPYAVKGYKDFCAVYVNDCAFETANPAAVSYEENIRMLRWVQLDVNLTVKPKLDQDNYGVSEHWTYPSNGYGDCEDYALEKRRRLLEAGLDPSALMMTVVRDEKGEGHAILSVRTTRGDMVLDNKFDDVVRWDQTSYTYVLVTNPANHREMLEVVPPYNTVPLVTSAAPALAMR